MDYKTAKFCEYQTIPPNTTSDWDPDTVLELIHPLRNTYKCTGWARSKRRRCMNSVASFKDGRTILGRLAQKSVSQAIASSKLEEAAECTLCYLHKGQVDDVTSKWISLLEEWASDAQYTKPTSDRAARSGKRAGDVPTYGHNTNCTSTGRFSVKKEEDWQQLQDDFAKANEEIRRTNEVLRFLMEMVAQQQKENQAREYAERVRRERTNIEKEAREREVYEKKECERRAAEKEARDREARRKAEQERKEREAREEIWRAAREQRVRNAREKAAREAESWTQSWKTYAEAWDTIKDTKSKKVGWLLSFRGTLVAWLITQK
jgi:hypothetical protein